MKSNRSSIIVSIFPALLMTIILFVTVQTPAAREKNVIMISVFQGDSSVKIDFSSKTRDDLANLLSRLQYLRVLEKNKTESLFQEIKQSGSPQIDHYLAIKYGKQMGVNLAILGTLSDIDYQQEVLPRLDDQGNDTNILQTRSSVLLSLEILNVDLNFVILTTQFKGSAVAETTLATPELSMKELTHRAIQDAVRKLWLPIQNAFPGRGLVIKKEKKHGNYTVYVDIGGNWGLNKQKTLSFFSRGEKLVHPVTGQTLNAGKGKLLVSTTPHDITAEYSVFHLTRRYFRKMNIGTIVEIDPVPFPNDQEEAHDE